MKLVLNGEEREFAAGLSLAALLDQLALKSDRVAVELNHDIVPRDRWTDTILSDADKLEIVHFVGGG
jgi:thiamine biosynthesis protein ThiS